MIPLICTSGDVSSGFQSQSGQPYLSLTEVYMLHVPRDSPLVWHLLTSWWPAWQPSCSFPRNCDQTLMRLKTGIYHASTATQCETLLPTLLVNVKLDVFGNKRIIFQGCRLHWSSSSWQYWHCCWRGFVKNSYLMYLSTIYYVLYSQLFFYFYYKKRSHKQLFL